MQRIILLTAAALALVACKDDAASQIEALESEREARMGQIAKITDPDAQSTLGFFVNILHQIQTSYIEIRTPYEGEVRYTQPALGRLKDYDSVSDMVDTFAGSHWANISFAGTVSVEQPFDYPLPHTMTWDTVTLGDGTTLTASTEYDQNATGAQVYDTGSGELRVIYNQAGTTPPDASPIASVSGTFTTKQPNADLTARFSANEAGSTQTLNWFEVELVEIENYLAIVNIRMADGSSPTIESDAIFIEATDATGAYLDSFSSSWGNPDDLGAAMPVFDELIQAVIDGDIDDLSEEALNQEMVARTGLEGLTSLFGHVGFRGTVDAVEVTLLPPSNDGEELGQIITLPALDTTGLLKGPIPDIPTRGAVYDHEKTSFLATAPIDIDPATVNTAIIPQHDAFQELVRFNYPAVISDLFIGTFDRYDDDAEDQIVVTFLDSSGNVITVPEDAFEFTINRVEFDVTQFPTPPARVTGQFPVVVMTDMPRETYDASTNPNAIEITGNQVRIERSQFRNWDTGNHHVLARDASGQLLKELRIQDISSSGEERVRVHYFYGEVAEVELLKRGNQETVIYSFDAAIEPAE